MSLPIKNGLGAETALKTDVVADEHIPHHRDTDRAALMALLDGVEGGLASILAKLIAAPATEAKQDTLKTSLDALTAAIKPCEHHFAVTASATALANATRRIVAGAAGTLTCTVGGVSAPYTVVAGQQLDVVATHITACPAGTVGQY